MSEIKACPFCQGKRAPVQGFTPGIPWDMHLRAYEAYRAKYGAQPALIDLEGRNCRGGFGVRELDVFIPGWRDEFDEREALKSSLNRASDACASVQRERDEAVIVLRRLVQSVDELISESAGVYGLHLNGDPAPWEELTVAGKYEEWLIELECSRAFLSRYEGEVK